MHNHPALCIHSFNSSLSLFEALSGQRRLKSKWLTTRDPIPTLKSVVRVSAFSLVGLSYPGHNPSAFWDEKQVNSIILPLYNVISAPTSAILPLPASLLYHVFYYSIDSILSFLLLN
jgi:hypothetical protein